MQCKDKKICKKYNLCPDKKIIICALPQLAEHNILDWENHWKEIEFLVSTISSRKQNLILSLHPKMEREKYLFLEEKYNCKIAEERLFEFLPIADLFIATFSSTIIWSVFCEISSHPATS